MVLAIVVALVLVVLVLVVGKEESPLTRLCWTFLRVLEREKEGAMWEVPVLGKVQVGMEVEMEVGMGMGMRSRLRLTIDGQ